MRALFEICKEAGHFHPFRNLIGVSAGAINASYLAAECDDLDNATNRLCSMWRELNTERVFKTDYVTVSRTAWRAMRAISFGGFSERLRPAKMGLLNVNPLRDLLERNIRFDRIDELIKSKFLHSLCVTATDYSTSMGVTFFMASPEVGNWKRFNRIGLRSQIDVNHVMASASIPIFFPPWPVGNRHFGDGCLRNTAPLSPARRIGASRMIVIGVRKMKDESLDDSTIVKPTLGRVLGVIINAIFMDAIESDIERMRIINENLRMADAQSQFRQIDIRFIQPSHAPSELAESRIAGLPPLLRFLISGLGSPRESAEILSYLTFDPIYLNALVDLGYSDLLKQKENLIQFLTL